LPPPPEPEPEEELIVEDAEVALAEKAAEELFGDLDEAALKSMKRSFKLQSSIIGFTFPGVDISQINKFSAFRDKPNEKPVVPKLEIHPISSTGMMKMTFSQEMFVPTDVNTIDYGGIFKFEVISAIDNSSVVDRKT